MIRPSLDQARPWIHLPVETKSREFQSRALLACAAAERGFGAVVGVKHRVAGLAAELPRGVYVEKSIQLPALNGIRKRTNLGHLECCLDEEGVVYIDADDYTAGRLAHPTLDLMRRFFTWGSDQAEVLRHFHPAVGPKLRVTGNPRVDLWRPELREVFRPAADEITATHGRFVLVTTAFAMVNNERGPSYFRDVLASNGRMDTSSGRHAAEGYIRYSTKLFELMRDAVVEIARQQPERHVVVRPHPSESLAPWQDATGRLPNVAVVRDGALTPWLLAAELVVHNNSTSGLEAALIGRPTVAFVPMSDERYDQNLPNPVSVPVADAEALAAAADVAFAGEPLPGVVAARGIVERHIAALDGRLACDRLVDAMLELDAPRLPLQGSMWRTLRAALATAPGRVERQIARLRSSGSPATPAVSSSKFPGVSLAEVEGMVAQLHAVSGRFGQVMCIEHAPDVFAFVDPSVAPA